PMFLFPNRNDFFNPLDGVTTSFKGIFSMWCRNCNCYSNFRNIQSTNSMCNSCFSIRPSFLNLFTNFYEFLLCHWNICLIFKIQGLLSFSEFSNDSSKSANCSRFSTHNFIHDIYNRNLLICNPILLLHILLHMLYFLSKKVDQRIDQPLRVFILQGGPLCSLVWNS